jgi:hypothetical protein
LLDFGGAEADGEVNGEAGTGAGFLVAFGFLASRLLFCWPLAMGGLLRGAAPKPRENPSLTPFAAPRARNRPAETNLARAAR